MKKTIVSTNWLIAAMVMMAYITRVVLTSTSGRLTSIGTTPHVQT